MKQLIPKTKKPNLLNKQRGDTFFEISSSDEKLLACYKIAVLLMASLSFNVLFAQTTSPMNIVPAENAYGFTKADFSYSAALFDTDKNSQVQNYSDGNSGIYVDNSVKNFPKITNTADQVLQFVSHGRAGELFIDGKWKNAQEIAAFIKPMINQENEKINHVNIYACDFASGVIGKEAVTYLENTLGVSIAASTNITGRDGDWTLEVGQPLAAIAVLGYEGNLQCAAPLYTFKTGMTVASQLPTANWYPDGTQATLNTTIDGSPNLGLGYTAATSITGLNVFTFTYPTPTAINQIRILESAQFFTSASVFNIQASNDGTTWTTLASNQTIGAISGGYQTLTFPNITPFSRYRIVGVSGSTVTSSYINEFYFRVSCTLDSDGDGVYNDIDLDDDNDGVLDTVENTCTVPLGVGSTKANLDWDRNLNTNSSLENNDFSPSIITASSTITMGAGLNYSPIGASWKFTYQTSTTTLSEAIAAQQYITVTIPVSATSTEIVTLTDWVTYNSFLPQSPTIGIWISTDPTFATYTTLYDGINTNATVSTSSYFPTPLIAPYTLEYGATYYVRVILPGSIASGQTQKDYFMDVFGFNGFCQTDTDSDYVANTLDLDSDGDGCTDAYEAGATAISGVTMQSGNVINGTPNTTTSLTNAVVAGIYGTNGFANSLEAVADNGTYKGAYTYNDATNANTHTCPVICTYGTVHLPTSIQDVTSATGNASATDGSNTGILTKNITNAATDIAANRLALGNNQIQSAVLDYAQPIIAGDTIFIYVRDYATNWYTNGKFEVQLFNGTTYTTINTYTPVSGTAGVYDKIVIVVPSTFTDIYTKIRLYIPTANFSFDGGTGTYVYLDAVQVKYSTCNTCPAGSSAPILSSTLVPFCTSQTANLTTITAINQPANTTVTWHSGTPATSANLVTTPTAVGGGTYYAAFYNSSSNCYSAISTGGTATTKVNVSTDTDCDGVTDLYDLDDDNDGILDISEMTCATIAACDTITAGGPFWTNNSPTDTWGISSHCTGWYSLNSNFDFLGSNLGSGFAGDPPGWYIDLIGQSDVFYPGHINSGAYEPEIGMIRHDFQTIPGQTYTYNAWFHLSPDDLAGMDPVMDPAALRAVDTTTGAVLATNDLWSTTPTYPGYRTITFTATSTITQIQIGLTNGIHAPINNNWMVKPDNFLSPQNSSIPTCTLVDLDTDGDNIPNHLDTDSDGDNCPDAIEGGGSFTAANLTTSNNLCNTTTPSCVDANGVPTVVGATGQTIGDSQNDLVQGADCVQPDTDGDGLPDTTDIDDDNDGISDVQENQLCGGATCDTDGDGTPDQIDLDSDNDGLLDVVEGGDANLDTNNDGVISNIESPDADGDGMADAAETTLAPDFDGDGNPDFQDLDSDNDGINDVIEGNHPDTNNDGLVDNPLVDTDNDGIADSVDGTDNGFGSAGGAPDAPDFDGDGSPDYNDLDSDNDGLNDVVEAGLPDPDGNGLVTNPLTDTDNDGIPDSVDGLPTFGDASSPTLPNSDSNGNPDFRDLDSDNDGINDVVEAGLPDPDGDGLVTNPLTDTDNDGIPDSVDGAPTVFADSGSPTAPDTDGDGTPDFQEPNGTPVTGTDTDGDGILDPVDGATTTYGDAPMTDTDGDGIPDTTDIDDDNDGISDVQENQLCGGATCDTDGDGTPDQIDLDSDNDGLLDVVEGGDANLDTNNDGVISNIESPDADGDGMADAAETTLAPDFDGDGNPDFQDLDSDNDGINDVIEGNHPDTNNDGLVDNPLADADNDGIADSVDGTDNGFGSAGGAPDAPDFDGDGSPDYNDLDSDNDGLNDVVEAGLPDPDGNGLVTNPLTDTDNDGIPDSVDGLPTFGDANSPALPNSDSNGNPDFRDLDSDNDGINDVVEAGLPDPDGNGLVDNPLTDTDNDGIPDSVDGAPTVYADNGSPTAPDTDSDGTPDYQEPNGTPVTGTDTDGDGILDPVDGAPATYGDAPMTDTDGDGIPDTTDIDDDNDGISDVQENQICGGATCDTDGDGTPDQIDLDSDNDGLLDVVEGGDANLDTNNDGVISNIESPDADGDGMADAAETTLAPDFDGDGNPDFQDLDSDNDGINDVIEGNHPDTNNDGLVDNPLVDTDNDGIADSVDGTDNGFGSAGGAPDAPDFDGDGSPDYNDLDSDNDGLNDVVEAGLPDPDGNGLVTNPLTDTDNDGIPDSVDGLPTFGDASSPALPNSDSNGNPDFRDLDSDNDGINDVVEAGLPDPDGNGLVDNPLTDTDNDGIPDSVDGAPTVFADSGSPAAPDTDSDGTPDFQEPNGTPVTGTDTDGDGILDPVDGATTTYGDAPMTDTDGDGIPDTTDIDDDNDGISDVQENQLCGGATCDTDGDGTPDQIDLDSDNDGLLDVVEGGDANLDTNNDGVISNIESPDADGDGMADAAETTLAPDFDGDGNPDFQDLDSDNDGINDVIEGNHPDTNNDGLVDNPLVDTDNDGIADSVDGTDNGFGSTGGAPDAPDFDGDGSPDYNDLDSDNDGLNDVVEAGLPDPDGNGLVTNPLTDTDNDGIPDSVDGLPTFGDASSPALPNSDSNGNPDFRDLDSDNDGINDVVEAGLPDPDGNGLVTNPLTDTDNDGIPDSVDGAPTVFADSGSPTAPRYR
jgi:hypothetical protein